MFFCSVVVLAACSSQTVVGSTANPAPTPDTNSQPEAAVTDELADNPADSQDLQPEDLALPVDVATALLELPVTTLPLEFVLFHDQEENVRYVDLASPGTVTISDGGGITAVWTTGDAIFFARRPGLLNRWDPATQTVTTTKIPSGDVIGGARYLLDGSLAVHTFNLGIARDFLFVYEPSGEIRCRLETEDSLRVSDNGLILSRERSETQDASGERVFTISPKTCLTAEQVPESAEFGRTLGGASEMLIIAEPVSENESTLVRYDFNGEWTEVLKGDLLAIRGRPQFGAGSVWAQVWSDGNTDLYRFSPDTLKIEDQWRVSVGRPNSWVVQDDAVWLVGCCPDRLTKLDVHSGEIGHFPLPLEGSNTMREVAGGLLIGRPAAGYLFNYEQQRFERMPDWLLLESQDTSYRTVAPDS